MKKYVSLSVIFLLIHFSLSAQTLQPGIGYKEIYLGMDIKEAIAVIGKPKSVVSRKKEKDTWEQFGYHTDKAFLFQLPFEKVYEFEENKYAIWKIYTKDDKVICVNTSIYGISKKSYKKITTTEGIKFGDSEETVKNIMGSDFIQKQYGVSNDDLMYLSRGILFIMPESGVSNILFFEKMPPHRIKEIEEQISE